jgi:hypothetical protein
MSNTQSKWNSLDFSSDSCVLVLFPYLPIFYLITTDCLSGPNSTHTASLEDETGELTGPFVVP